MKNIYKVDIPQYNMGGVLSGATTGASIGTALFPGIGTAVGAGVGAIGGWLAGENADKKKQQALLQQRKDLVARQNEMSKINSQAVLSQYSQYGNPDISYYAKGGTIDLIEGADYEVEGNEVVQGQASLESSTPIATDMQVATGPSHAGGGVLGIGGERVFSDRAKVDNNLLELLSELGIGKVKGKTYADVAENIGKKKGKMEAKLGIPYSPSNRTAEKTLPRIDAALDILFAGQEEGKNDDPYRRNGREFADGGLLLPEPYLDYTLPDVEHLRRPATTPTVAQTIATDNQITEVVPLAKAIPLTETTPVTNRGGFDWGSMLGQAGNLANYIANSQSINDLDTSVNRELLPMPVYNYTDRSENARREVGRMTRTGQQALGTSSRTVNAANQAAITAQGLNAINQINESENQRRDRYNEFYNDRAWRTTMANVGIVNQASDQRRELENQKNVYLPQQARAAFMQGVMGNEAVRQQKKSDKDRLRISALLNDNNGVVSRAAEKLGYANVEEYIDALLNR